MVDVLVEVVEMVHSWSTPCITCELFRLDAVPSLSNFLETRPTAPTSWLVWWWHGSTILDRPRFRHGGNRSGSYDVFNACENLFGGELEAIIGQGSGRVPVRPDDGELPEIVLDVFDDMALKFRCTTTASVRELLPDRIRVLQGDGVDIDTLEVPLGCHEGSGLDGHAEPHPRVDRLLRGTIFNDRLALRPSTSALSLKAPPTKTWTSSVAYDGEFAAWLRRGGNLKWQL